MRFQPSGSVRLVISRLRQITTETAKPILPCAVKTSGISKNLRRDLRARIWRIPPIPRWQLCRININTQTSPRIMKARNFAGFCIIKLNLYQSGYRLNIQQKVEQAVSLFKDTAQLPQSPG